MTEQQRILVENASKFYKMWTVWIYALIGIMGVLYANHEQFIQYVPEEYRGWVLTALSIAGILARVIKQPALHTDTENQ